ncbi:MAG: zinc ribbon domain-containing protein [Kiritimatiellia bacterium]|nr:zinc ribbon domain-containing protein [Kiritimatiellia bacterium]
MPIYEYECKKCRRRFEHLLKNARDLPQGCPHCGGKSLEKVFSGFSVAVAQKINTPASACASCPSAGCPHRGH